MLLLLLLHCTHTYTHTHTMRPLSMRRISAREKKLFVQNSHLIYEIAKKKIEEENQKATPKKNYKSGQTEALPLLRPLLLLPARCITSLTVGINMICVA